MRLRALALAFCGDVRQPGALLAESQDLMNLLGIERGAGDYDPWATGQQQTNEHAQPSNFL
eukprot:13243360-Alexandrium_andersonii.AAC.1